MSAATGLKVGSGAGTQRGRESGGAVSIGLMSSRLLRSRTVSSLLCVGSAALADGPTRGRGGAFWAN